MADVTSIASQLDRLDVSPRFQDYSKVIIKVSNETSIEVGDDTGRTLELDCPWGTQAMAQNILTSLQGYLYQPYKASGAQLDPAAEIGDGVNMRGNYGGVYTRKRKFTSMMKADISAPHDEEINHEYQFETPQEREFTRQINDVKASLIIANDRIDASVQETGGENGFSWSLTSDSHKWYANGNEVMAVTATGLSVKGHVEATEGKIGGFNISASAIWNNISSYGGSQSNGVYVGTDGIQLGQDFKVNSSGAVKAKNIEATEMKLWGTLYFWNGSSYVSIDANSLRSGAKSAYDNSSYWSGGASGGYTFSNATKSSTTSNPNFYGKVWASQLNVGDGSSSYRRASWHSETINGTSYYILAFKR